MVKPLSAEELDQALEGMRDIIATTSQDDPVLLEGFARLEVTLTSLRTDKAALHEVLPIIVFAIYYDDLGDEDIDTWESSRDRWEHRWKPALLEEHSGDCTNECHSCFRCQAENCVRLAGLIEEGLRDD